MCIYIYNLLLFLYIIIYNTKKHSSTLSRWSFQTARAWNLKPSRSVGGCDGLAVADFPPKKDGLQRKTTGNDEKLRKLPDGFHNCVYFFQAGGTCKLPKTWRWKTWKKFDCKKYCWVYNGIYIQFFFKGMFSEHLALRWPFMRITPPGFVMNAPPFPAKRWW